MKLLLVFALCGVTCCLAGPTCSKDEISKCSQGPPGPEGTEEEELDKSCRHTSCWVEIYDRCGTAAFGKMPFPVKGYKIVLDALCDKSSPLNKKYMDNIECIRRGTSFDELQRLAKMCGIEDRPKDEYCMKIPDGFTCAMDYITKKCGEDAGEVFRVAALPAFDPYDCLSS